MNITPQKPAEYQMSFSILKASRNMDNALFFVNVDSSNNLLILLQIKFVLKVKRKIQASLDHHRISKMNKIKYNFSNKFTSNIHLTKY